MTLQCISTNHRCHHQVIWKKETIFELIFKKLLQLAENILKKGSIDRKTKKDNTENYKNYSFFVEAFGKELMLVFIKISTKLPKNIFSE